MMKLVPFTIEILPVNEAKKQLKRVLKALPGGDSEWPSKCLLSGTRKKNLT